MLVQIKDSLKQRFWGELTVRLEGRIDIAQNPVEFFHKFESVFEFCNDERKAKHGKDSTSVTIDLTKVEFIYPSALIFIVSLKESLANDARIRLQVTDRSPLHEYLCTCGFADTFSIPLILDNAFRRSLEESEVIELQIGGYIPDFDSSARKLIDLIDSHGQLETFFRNRSEESVSEILKNIHDHSGATQHYMLGQSYPRSGNVRLAIYDNGVGIKRHMTKIPYRKQHPVFRNKISDAEFRKLKTSSANHAIDAASIYGVSATKYQSNSGAGLDFLINEFSKPLSGHISVLSEDGYVSWENGEKRLSISLPVKVRGTMVSITAKGLTNRHDQH